MRFVYRNRKIAFIGMFCLFGAMMILIKFTEFSPTCLFREDSQTPMMIRDQVDYNIFFFFLYFQLRLVWIFNKLVFIWLVFCYWMSWFWNYVFFFLFNFSNRSLYLEVINNIIHIIDKCHWYSLAEYQDPEQH